MITSNGPYVIEYNVRFGDPECQILMRNLQTDFLKIINLNIQDKVSKLKIRRENKSIICVVLASKGYPGIFNTNRKIENLEKAKLIKGVEIFHAGTEYKGSGVFSTGGRVLSITAKGKSISEARRLAYKALEQINWPYGFYRKDIGLLNA